MTSPYAPSLRPAQPIQNQSRGLLQRSNSCCLPCPDTDNLSTAELSIFHGCQLMKSAASAAPVHHASPGLSPALLASHFSCKCTIFNSCTYTNPDPIKSCSYTNFHPRKVCSYTNFLCRHSPQARCTEPLRMPSVTPVKLKKRLNQYTQTGRQGPPVVRSVFFPM